MTKLRLSEPPALAVARGGARGGNNKDTANTVKIEGFETIAYGLKYILDLSLTGQLRRHSQASL